VNSSDTIGIFHDIQSTDEVFMSIETINTTSVENNRCA